MSITFGVSGVITLAGVTSGVDGEITWATENLTLDGNTNIIVDGGGNSRVFNVSANNATIENITVRNGASTNGGGIQHVGAGTLVVNNTIVTNNQTTGSGGGILQAGMGRLSLTASTISGNSAGVLGGGINGDGTVTVLNSTISGNSAGNYGGGIDLLATGGDLTLINSTISGNSAGLSGGGIEGAGAANNVTVVNSTISGNSAAVSGGGGFALGTLSLTNSVISGNSAGNRGGGFFAQGNTTIANSTIASNVAAIQGGGIFMTGSNLSLNMTNSRIQNNRALTGSDGGVAGFVGTGGSVTVESSIISGNSAGLDTGGLFAQGTVTIRNSSIYNNTGANRIGGIALGPNTIANLNNSTVSSNSSGINGGGGIFGLAGTQLNLTNSTIAFNTTSGDGGGIYTTTNANHTIVNTIIANNGDTGSNAPDLFGNFSSTNFRHNLIQSTTGITAGAPVDGVNGNIVGQDPLLGPLQNNGGTTPTHALLPGSPAIDAGDNGAISFSLDQRGQIRIFNGTVDIGAFESQTVITIVPPDFALSLPDPLNVVLDNQDIETVSRDRVSDLLASNQICEAAATLDQLHTQNFGQLESSEPITCAEMQQRLPDDAAILYVFAQTDKLHLINLRSEDEPSHYEFPLPRAAVIDQVAQFQQAITNPVLRRSETFLEPAQQLHQWLVQPILAELQTHGIQNILLSWDDGLRTIPVAALHDGNQFLIEQYQTSLIPSLALTPTHHSRLQQAEVLALGIADFEQFTPLHAVPLELASIKSQFPSARTVQDAQATLDNFQYQLRSQPNQIVHLATHGAFRSGQVDNSYIQFWDGQLNLKAIEQVDWHQSAVELLVLSACQTALGDPAMEYGFAGLAVQAEAGAAVAGLWSAHDAATLALMREFYRQLSLGQPKGEALRQAQLALLNGTVRLDDKQLVGSGKAIALPPELHELGDRTFWHPYYWSAFTLIGNPW